MPPGRVAENSVKMCWLRANTCLRIGSIKRNPFDHQEALEPLQQRESCQHCTNSFLALVPTWQRQQSPQKGSAHPWYTGHLRKHHPRAPFLQRVQGDGVDIPRALGVLTQNSTSTSARGLQADVTSTEHPGHCASPCVTHHTPQHRAHAAQGILPSFLKVLNHKNDTVYRNSRLRGEISTRVQDGQNWCASSGHVSPASGVQCQQV